MILRNQAFFLFLQHGGDVSQQKIKCQPIRTREIGGVTLSDVLYDDIRKTRMSWLQNAVKYL